MAAKPPFRSRGGTDARSSAEQVFKSVTTKPVEPAAAKPAVGVPPVREMVSLRIDSDVLAHFQDDGPGWQDRINDALRKIAFG